MGEKTFSEKEIENSLFASLSSESKIAFDKNSKTTYDQFSKKSAYAFNGVPETLRALRN